MAAGDPRIGLVVRPDSPAVGGALGSVGGSEASPRSDHCEVIAAHEIHAHLFTRTEDWASPITERFAQVAQINREMRVYGRAVTQLLSTDIGWVTDAVVGGLQDTARGDAGPFQGAARACCAAPARWWVRG